MSIKPYQVDARGLKCPWPVLRAAKALREGHSAVLVMADDPRAERELAAFAQERGLRFSHAEEGYFLEL